jgi:hypothetical protein
MAVQRPEEDGSMLNVVIAAVTSRVFVFVTIARKAFPARLIDRV